MNKLKAFLQSKPIFLYLLPIFFVLHTYTENYFIPLKGAFLLAALYLGVSLFLSSLFWVLYKNWHKANLIAFILMAYNFFFGSIHDFLKDYFTNTLIVRYSFILPFTLIFFFSLILFLKKTKRSFTRVSHYLNWLFLLFILIDVGILFLTFPKTNISVNQLPEKLIICDTCSLPDIYLIVADEYAGSGELKDIFSFSNSDFENKLRGKGFFVVNNSKSNYNATIYSMASMFNMEYLKNLRSTTINHPDQFICHDLIKNSNLLHFLDKAGYSIYNYTFFDFGSQKKLVKNFHFRSEKELFTSQTFLKRSLKDVGLNFVTPTQLENVWKHNLYNNQKIDSATRKIAVQKSAAPKFVYTHLAMPHHPFFFDSNGKETSFQTWVEEDNSNKKKYIEYLVYTNKKLLALIDHINKASQQAPIILLMSDHGFRQFTESVDKKYYFMTLNAVFLPNGNYSGFYDGMSNVNQFRVVLNSQFGQNLPILKDTTIFLYE